MKIILSRDTMGRRTAAERLATARAAWPETAVSIDKGRVNTALVDMQCIATHIVPPYETLQQFIARAVDDAGHHVYQPMWHDRRERRATHAPPIEEGEDAMDLDEDDGFVAPGVTLIAHDDEAVDYMTYHKRRPYHDRAFKPVTFADVDAEKEMEQYTLEPMRHDGGVPLIATLVNTVNNTKLRGGAAYVPWIRGEGAHLRQSIVPVLAVQRTLLGIVCPYSSNHNRSFRLRYSRPFGSMHAIFPIGPCIQETASTNNALGELARQITVSLMRLAIDTPDLEVNTSQCNNRVFVFYTGRPVDFDRLLYLHPSVAHYEGKFEGTIVETPEFFPLRLLVFKRPVILVGTTTALAMRHATRNMLPYVLDATTEETGPLPPSLGFLNEKSRKRKRAEDDADGRRRKRLGTG